MKIVAINGSHKGEHGNTNIMVNAFLKGAKIAGVKTVNIFLKEKEIEHCRACKVCWFKNPGKCIIKDDMAEIISLMDDADIVILATPIYFDNISSMLNVFMDRLMVKASPYWGNDSQGECRHLTTHKFPKIIMMSNCGYPERAHFQVISHWIQRVARNINSELLAEIYASEGAILNSKLDSVLSYLDTLQIAGTEVATNMSLTEETKKLLEQKFIPDEIYIREAKKFVDNMLKDNIS
ncbi:flavodoxin family protein [Clostridium sp. HBUAS56017]|uniref:flavodoxin family protein n=1 Tax=Clostridium sp. HBUAS56017 TaxID=2571128 RepID=UPI0011785B74|nr:flavodoxin family protein [Clostridium sp. HBUAS56017]